MFGAIMNKAAILKKSLFINFFQIHISSLVEGLFCPSFDTKLFVLLLSCNSFNILDTRTLPDTCFTNIFLPFCTLHFHVLNGVCRRENIFNLDEVQFIIFFPFMIYALCILRKFALPKFTKIFSIVFYRGFIILALMFMSGFQDDFVYDIR